jgi:NAD(P)-dependent dehydrogenase (short-subunit alcohol dehydrogenase family)
MAELTGHRALVTGGTSGIGRSMAEALAAAGSRVAITGRTAERVHAVAREIGAEGVPCDVTDEDSVQRGVTEAFDRLGGLDLLVNNAGLGMRSVNPSFMSEPQPFYAVSPDGFRAVVDTNLTGYFLTARAVVPRMLAVGGGRVINISINHATMTRRGFVPYGPSRAGAEALSRVMAADLADTPIRVNLLLPGGATRTGMVPEETPPGVLDQLIDPAVMGPPTVWLASSAADDVHDERIVAVDLEAWLANRPLEHGPFAN